MVPAMGLPLFPGLFRRLDATARQLMPFAVTVLIKPRPGHAEDAPMIISDEQVRLALRTLHNTDRSDTTMRDRQTCEVSAELMDRICQGLEALPEMREERVEQARADLADGGLSADEVAGKMIGRIISDSLR